MARRPVSVEYRREYRRNLSDSGVGLRDSYDSAKQIREVFQGKPSKIVKQHSFGWPRFIMYLGITNAEAYLSDKMLGGGKLEFYKHIAEAPQYLFVNPLITTLVNDRGERVELRESRRPRTKLEGKNPGVFYAKSYEVRGDMPSHLGDLAWNKGVQWVDRNRDYFEARIPHSTLAAAKHPDTKETILVIYSAEGMHFVITGDKLSITADGIVY